MAQDSFNPLSPIFDPQSSFPRPGTRLAYLIALIILLVGLLWIFNERWLNREPADIFTQFTAENTFGDLIHYAGWPLWPILGCFLTGVAIFCERAFELRRLKHTPPDVDRDVVHTVDTRGVDAGLALCLEEQSSLARLLYAALLRYGMSRQDMEAAIHEEGARMLYDMRRNCAWLKFLGKLALLFGLLGTMLNLMQGLNAFAGGIGSFPAYAIATAMLPAAGGLIAAIPLIAAHQFLEARTADLAREAEGRGIYAIVTLDRKARRSIRLLDDLEEHLETKELSVAKTPPNLDAEFEEADRDKLIKTSATTPANQPVVSPEMPRPGKDSRKMGEDQAKSGA